MLRKALSISLVILFVSCQETIDCENILSTDLFKVSFFDIDSKTQVNRVFDSVQVQNSTIDTLLFVGDDLEEETDFDYDLPLNPNLQTSTFIFFDSLGIDTLRVRYNTNLSFTSEDCGTTIDYSNMEVVRSTFDSSVLINQNLEKTITINLEVYD